MNERDNEGIRQHEVLWASDDPDTDLRGTEADRQDQLDLGLGTEPALDLRDSLDLGDTCRSLDSK